MKARIHSPNLVHILFTIALAILLALSGIAPARALSLGVPASRLYATEPQSGIDCGCSATGAYVNPAAPVPLAIQQTLDSPRGKYHVDVHYGSGQITSLSVIRTSDSREIVWLGALPLDTHWLFSPGPGEDRFALYSVDTTYSGSQTSYYLYNLARATNPGVPVWDTITTLVDTEAAFSPKGQYFQYARVDSGMTYLMILDAQTGQSIYQTNFSAAPPPSGDEVRVASWGYSPDTSDRTFVYAYVNSQTVSSVYWAVVNLVTGARVREATMTNAIGSQGLLPFWQFSPCGDAIGLVNPSGMTTEVQLFATKDGTVLNPGGAMVSTATFTLKNNLIIHYVDTGSTNVTTLANNTADESCSGGGGGGTTPRPSGIDCGCSATGSYKNPAAPAPLTLQPVNSPHGKYRVAWQYGTDIISSLTVSKISDTGTWQVIFELNMLPTSTFWGFSSDDDRFALYSIQGTILGSQTSYYLYNLVRETNPGSPIWQITTPMLDTEAAFSPHGRYFQYAWVNNGMTYLTIRDARTGELIYQTNFTAAPPPGDNKFRVANWGYSPDTSDRTFVYAYVNSQVVSSVYWGVVNLHLTTNKLVHDELLVNAVSSQTIQPFWKFSPCGDAIGLVNTELNSTNVRLFATKDGALLNPGGLDISNVYSLALKNNLTSHLADTGSTTYTLADNNADLACTATPGTPALKSFSVSPESVRGGVSAQGTVWLTQPAPSGGINVNLESDTSAVQVPSSVKVLYGNSAVYFNITTSEVSADTTAYITATLGETTNTATLTLTPSPVASLTMSHYGIIAGATETATVTLRDPAPAGGAVVNLSTAGSFRTLTWVRVPAGETSTTFDVTANLNITNLQARLTATYLNASKTTNFMLLRASSVAVTPAEVTGGADALTVTVVLPVVAPEGGIVVPLNDRPADIVDLPPSVTIESGQTSGSITANTIPIDESTDVTILAGVLDDAESPTATVHILAAIPSAFPGGPYVVLAGEPVTLIGDGTDPKGEPLTFAWDLNGDETFETAGATAVFTDTAGHNREIPIWLRACNTSGYCGTGLTFVRVRNPGQLWVMPPVPSQDILMKNNDWGLPDGPTPFMLEGFGQVIDVVGDAGFIVALQADGTVWTMGDNYLGQTGNEDVPTGQIPGGYHAASTLPVQADISDVVVIASGGDHVLALKRDGTVWTWGSHSDYLLGNGTWDLDPHPTPTQVENLSGVVAIATSEINSFALTRKGEIYGWGIGEQIYGRACYDVLPACKITTIPEAVALQVTPAWAVVLKRDGTVWYWGGYDLVTYENRFEPEQIEGLSGITAISTSGGSISSNGGTLLALKNDGTVWGIGKNSDGQLGRTPWPDPYIKEYGEPIQIPGLTGVRALASGDALQSALLQDGTVAGWGCVAICPGEFWLPSPLAGLSNVQAISVGDDFRLAIVPGAQGLAITQTADQETVSSGDPIGFTISITNNSEEVASSVTLTDTLPANTGLSWSLSGTDAASCTITAGALSCDFGDVAPGAAKAIKLTSPTPNSSGECSNLTISNTATVTASNQPDSRSATASISVLCPRVSISVSADTPSVTAGDPVSYTVTLGNMAEGIARNVISETTLPNNPGLSWSITDVTPASAANGCAINTSGTSPMLLCSYDQMDPQQEVLITVASPTTSGSCGILESGGTVTSSNGSGGKSKRALITVNCTVAHTVQPGEAATLTLLNGRGQIDFPANLVAVPTTFTYTKQDAPSQSLGSYTFAGLSFTLVATDPDGVPVTSFPASYTMRLSYQDSDWQNAGIADESLLNLAYWEAAAGQWVNVLPCDGCSLDTEQNSLVVVLNHLTEFALIGSIATDAEAPTTSASVSPEANASGWYAGPVTVTLSASDSDSGIHHTEYDLNGAGWTIYSTPFDVSTESASSTVHNTVQYRSTDNAGNVEETKSLTISIDTTAPTVSASVPLSGNAVLGEIKFGVNLADALSGPASAMLSIREADEASGKEIGYENLATVYNSTSGNWELDQHFDTTQLPDGF